MKLWEKLKCNMNRNPAQIVGEGEVGMTYEEIIEFSEQFADKIRNKKCCAVYCDSEMMTSLGLLACFAAGVTAVPLSKKYGELHCRKNKVNKGTAPRIMRGVFLIVKDGVPCVNWRKN